MSTVGIGAAAALYGLEPSTLRWWEHEGVLGPGRLGGRRRYEAEDLRRIGLAYLCRVTGMMSLERVAVIAGGADRDTWGSVVHDQVAALDRHIDRMRSARDYLEHLLVCPGDDMGSCPYLDGELLARTPRGRFRDPDLVAAARAASGDEKPDDGDATRSCSCGRRLARTGRGRPPRHCSPTCRQRAYRDRRRSGRAVPPTAVSG